MTSLSIKCYQSCSTQLKLFKTPNDLAYIGTYRPLYIDTTINNVVF